MISKFKIKVLINKPVSSNIKELSPGGILWGDMNKYPCDLVSTTGHRIILPKSDLFNQWVYRSSVVTYACGVNYKKG